MFGGFKVVVNVLLCSVFNGILSIVEQYLGWNGFTHSNWDIDANSSTKNLIEVTDLCIILIPIWTIGNCPDVVIKQKVYIFLVENRIGLVFSHSSTWGHQTSDVGVLFMVVWQLRDWGKERCSSLWVSKVWNFLSCCSNNKILHGWDIIESLFVSWEIPKLCRVISHEVIDISVSCTSHVTEPNIITILG